ncbi:hypothetical protein L3X38_040904 [Prunus dulcis]|uniref:Uncharacterized protein n=1 Tax=Prunus dulcis TaxID=3755 RepID=A0AAD4UTQ8_PRUDU|nr:hypothetical protein L3X38_040904 [Prunus dulcis]
MCNVVWRPILQYTTTYDPYKQTLPPNKQTIPHTRNQSENKENPLPKLSLFLSLNSQSSHCVGFDSLSILGFDRKF